MSLGAVILAAGQGTRLKSRIPKVLHQVLGKSLLEWVLEAVAPLALKKTVVVAGHLRQQVVEHLMGRPVEVVVQEPPLGTGDAFRVALPSLSSCRQVLVLPGDAPLLTWESLNALLKVHLQEQAAATVLTAILSEPASYGRVLREEGKVVAIVEAKDATLEQLALKEVNAGVYVFDLEAVIPCMGQLSPNNSQGEYYLTDLVAALVAKGRTVAALTLKDAGEMLGVNTRAELAQVSRILADRLLRFWQEQGVTLVDPATTWVEAGCILGQDTVLEPGVVIRAGSVLGEGCWVGAHSVLEGVHLAPGSRVPPLSYLKEGN